MELYIGFPKNSPLVGGVLTNNNARYEAQSIFHDAAFSTNLFQSINPTSTMIELRDYFYQKLDYFARQKGGTVSTTPDLMWNGQLKEYQDFIINQTLECD